MNAINIKLIYIFNVDKFIYKAISINLIYIFNIDAKFCNLKFKVNLLLYFSVVILIYERETQIYAVS